MNPIFILSVFFTFVSVLIESASLYLQWKGKKLASLFGKDAFNFHVILTLTFWGIAVWAFIALQSSAHPLFHQSIGLKYLGLVILIAGFGLFLWAFNLLGFKRSLGLNFFKDNVPLLEDSLYKYIKNPQIIGFCMGMVGFALFTQSIYNLVIAIEVVILMFPHTKIENLPLKRKDKDANPGN